MEEIRDDLSFHLCCKQMAGSDIYIYNVKSNFTVYMVKALLNRRLDIPEDQQRLIHSGLVMEDNKSLAYYNVNYSSEILIVRRLCGGARTKSTAFWLNSDELDAIFSDSSESTSSSNSDTSEDKTVTSKSDLSIKE